MPFFRPSPTENPPEEPPVVHVVNADKNISQELRIAGEIAWRFIAIIAALYLVGRGVQITSSVTLPVAVALLFTALGQPLVNRLHRHAHIPTYGGAAIAIILGIILITGTLAIAGGQLITGVAQLIDRVSGAMTQIQTWLATGPLQIGGDQINEAITHSREWLSANASTLTSGAVTVGSQATSLVAGLVIALIVTFFFLGDGPNIWGWLVRLMPRGVRTDVHNAARRGWTTVGAYVRTQILVAAIDAVGICIGAFFLNLPLVVPLGLIVFLSSFIPMVGAFASGALAVLLALVTQGPIPALIMMLVVLAVQQLEGNVLQPVLMSRSVSIHPLATLLGVAVGSFLFGIVGAVFAVPAMAFTNVVVLYLKGYDKFPELGVQSVPGGTFTGERIARAATNGDEEAENTQRSTHHRDTPDSPTQA
ncbi:pheromone autoinducer 2 transporter [Dermatophilus congolensis]|uniref:Pheromone autoinducer 2 transporter n=1 Tax=Dermatophilus congolensis TaxID=1863 RepID=A0AA46H129_9MICO|nr:AI-2E family transporter [Dermatophilus congolensis]STD12860.1 pheromone autoinducer 2 transporter [Dermatophilus congolensis]